MRLRAHLLDMDAGDKYIVVLNEQDARALHVLPGNRVDVRRNGRSITAIVDISRKTIPPGFVGLFVDCWEKLGVREGEVVDVLPALDPESLQFIRKKLDGEELSREEMLEIIKDIVDRRLTTAEASAFVTATYIRGLSLEETVYLTEAIVESGETVKISKHPVVDKHCIGGVPNNRVTMIFVPVLAALGYYVPKTSSRAITSPAGTADTMEVLARVDLSVDEIREITENVGGVIAWGGGTGMATADDILIQIRRPLSLDPRGMLLASIMAKKKAVNAEYVVIDIPVGPEAKVKDVRDGERLGKDFVLLGQRLGMHVHVLLSDGSAPIGRGVGPALEARDVLRVLERGEPRDLLEKALDVISNAISFVSGADLNAARARAEEIIRSGGALEKFKEIVDAQDGDPDVSSEDIALAKYREELVAEMDGKVVHISNHAVARAARIAGAPFDKQAGLYLHVRVGDAVRKGERLVTLFSNDKRKLRAAVEEARNIFRMEKA